MDATMNSLPADMTQDQWDAICEQMSDPRWDDDRAEGPEEPAAMSDEDIEAMIAKFGGEFLADNGLLETHAALRCTEEEFEALRADDAAVCLGCGELYFAWDEPESPSAKCSRPCEHCDDHVFMVTEARAMGQVVFTGKNNSDLRGC